MVSEFNALTVEELAAAVRRGLADPVEVTEDFCDAIAHDRFNAFITPCPDYALTRARRRLTGPLAGVPLAVKDMFDTAGIRTTYGSSIFQYRIPKRTASSVSALEEAGAILVGKANQHEFAWGITSQNPHWGDVQNPVFPGRVAGGSSGGNAAALAGGMSMIGLGTDTGGSVRVPAACCSVVGFKPKHGLISTAGVFPLAPSFDTVGPMARTVRDCVLVYSILSGRPIPRPKAVGARVGVLSPTGIEDELIEMGANVEKVELPTPTGDLSAVFLAECAIAHSRWYPAKREEYGFDSQQKWDAAVRITCVERALGLRALRRYRRDVAHSLEYDVLVSPTLGMTPPPITFWEPDVRDGMAAFTRRYNQLRWPAIAVGNLQFAGPDEAVVLGLALAWEDAHST